MTVQSSELGFGAHIASHDGVEKAQELQRQALANSGY